MTPDPVIRVLASFYYYREPPVMKRLLEMTRLPLHIFADSGAFSAWTTRRTGGSGMIALADYAAWLTEHRELFTVMANLDVIGDPKATARNQLALEERGLPVLPIWHATSPISELEALCRDYKYLAMGGTAVLRGRGKALTAFTARVMMTAREHGTVLHGFGRSATADLAALPFYSVDSASWAYNTNWGSFVVFNGSGIKQIQMRDAARYAALLRAHGVNPAWLHRNFARKGKRPDVEQFRAEYASGMFCSGVAWKRFEAWLRTRHHVPAPPGQDGDGTQFFFADNEPGNLVSMCRAVEWLTCPQLEEA